jgi:anti-sigma regulatory factor (Ser/Thr protein kinase)
MTNPTTGDRALTFELKKDLTEIATLAETLEVFCARNGIGSEVASVVSLALEEVIANLIVHGSADQGDHRIRIDLAWVGTNFTARVEDEARLFEPAADDDSALALPSAESPGGPELDLIRTLMDEVTYSRAGGRNVLLIRKSTQES